MILVFGRTGQVATELQRLGDVTALGRDQADLADPGACAEAIRTRQPRVVINAAAYTAVDRAEDEEPLATTINGASPAAMARACAAIGTPLVHISTDYVFDGSGTRPWSPDDPTRPINAYGRSKLAGETGIRAAGGSHAILRTSWVFSAHGNNFVKTMLRLGKDCDRLSIVADQVGGPTSAAAIARVCLTVAEALCLHPDRTGTYHLSGGPDVSWADFARAVFARTGRTPEVADIPSSAYPTPAARPHNSRLDNTALTRAFNLGRPDWQADLDEVLRDLDRL
ncbi:dTDP-4-dehydrorhamnose reductase [Mameliella alba]|uniref:dTDP-4-dehydrorhamnose reductase n=1 Tax=Mameliella alba TaxID=561184 RepID=UPI00088F5C0B|nr:dTDP-4-dehydrorhamnose reductase [Mameliella alba]OWV49221.1 NAD(P)-dependent oxidoreductase [Mameliella alba]PTR40783.1 dTDP-4-dehydrorhamnose reductase [Mameliella alba]GGF46265.1 NAD(P)-dependent oxidoreductase [Mameliella alba]SDC64814.1 dTDP-4-dehydrorhamnose reductase [Mameliella alba]